MAPRKWLTTSTFLLFVLFSAAQGNPVVHTKSGAVSGSVKNGISIFKGIPFAAPPVGELRWKAPQPVTPWKDVRVCTTFGASPMQNSPASFSMWTEEYLIAKEPISEDCLYLNVWSGAKSKEKRPVLVWIYGGGLNSGGGNVPIYDGEAMAAKGIVVVNINYRVGVFGFFSHPELTKESGVNASGNYGLMDQVAALKWVQQNITAFGGDPDNVTIAGQSAGSTSVNALVASPLAKGLFNKAIAQSGASFTNRNVSLQQAEADGVKIQERLNTASVADMRKISAAELLPKAQGRGMIIDGYVLPDAIVHIFTQGKQNDVVLMTGWNEDEGFSSTPKNAVDFRTQVAQQYGADSLVFLKHYPAGTDAEAAASQLKSSRDISFGIQNYTWANIQAQQGKKAYVYRFTRKVPATGEYTKYGAFHTAEVPYVFDNLSFINRAIRPWETADAELAKLMSAYWANFMLKADPNGNGIPLWPVYGQDKQIMELGLQPTAKTIPEAAALDFMYQKMKAPR